MKKVILSLLLCSYALIDTGQSTTDISSSINPTTTSTTSDNVFGWSDDSHIYISWADNNTQKPIIYISDDASPSWKDISPSTTSTVNDNIFGWSDGSHIYISWSDKNTQEPIVYVSDDADPCWNDISPSATPAVYDNVFGWSDSSHIYISWSDKNTQEPVVYVSNDADPCWNDISPFRTCTVNDKVFDKRDHSLIMNGKENSTDLMSLKSGKHADYFAEGRVAYFHPANKRFREIYSGGAIYGVELDARIWKPLYAWLGTSCFYQSGPTATKHAPTYVTLIPINTGVKSIFHFNEMWKPYLGAGISATHVQAHTKSPYLVRNLSSWGCGGVFKSGLLINPISGLLIDLYVDYLLQTVSFSHGYKHGVYFYDANVSGFSFGGSVGWKF